MRLRDYRTPSDKRTSHGYLEVYDRLGMGVGAWPGPVLEIGVWDGHSISMWADLMPMVTVMGYDIDLSNSASVQFPGNVELWEGDAYTQPAVDRTPWCDWILDDGSHSLQDMCFVAAHYSALTDLLVIEDVLHPEWFSDLTDALPADLKRYSYGVDRRHVAPNSPFGDDLIFIVDKR